MSSLSTKEHVLFNISQNYCPNVVFTLEEVYRLCLETNYCSEIYQDAVDPEANIRAAIQTLEKDGFLKMYYYENKDWAGTYCLLESKTNIDPNENFFDLEELKKLGRIREDVPGITFVDWAILNKDEVMSHTIARELGIPCQTRVGTALFQQTIDEITADVADSGYDYRCYQPAVSELDQPIHHKGKKYKWIVRDGNNRFELPWKYFPCAIISGETEYSLLQYGAVSNAPSKEKKNDCTPDDVKYMIKLGFEHGEIAKDLESVIYVLKTLYKEVKKNSRKIFANEILNEEGVKATFEPFDLKKAKQHLQEHFNIDDASTSVSTMTENMYRFIMGWGRRPDFSRQWYMIFKNMLKFPNIPYTMYAFLETGEGVSPKPNENNVKSVRVEIESTGKEYIQHCCDVADAHRAGTLIKPNIFWMPQANNTEKYNQFQ